MQTMTMTASTRIRRGFSLSLLLLLLSAVAAVTAYSGDSTHVNIHLPDSLYIDGGYSHFLGHFGRAAMTRAGHYVHDDTSDSYGSTSLPLVLAPKEGLCHPLSNYTLPQQPALLITPLITDACSYVTQTRRAQHLGAAGLILVDPQCLAQEDPEYCSCKNTTLPCRDDTVVLKDDGSGGDVTIPTLLLKHQDGSPILDKLHANNKTKILMSLQWTSQVPTKKTHKRKTKLPYGMWLDLQDIQHTRQLTKDLRNVALAVGAKSTFYPSYVLYSGKGMSSAKECGNSCFKTKYCYPSANGTLVVEEILRRLCLWKSHGDNGTATNANSSMGQAWWDYVTYFDDQCADLIYPRDGITPAEDVGTKCRHDALTKAARLTEQDITNLDACMDSGSDKGDSHLDDQLQSMERWGIYQAPTMWINGKVLPTYWNAPSAHATLQGVCRGFATSGRNPPQACEKCLEVDDKTGRLKKSPADILACAKQYPDRYDDDPNGKGGGRGIINNGAASTAFKVLFWLASVAAICGALWLGYQKRLERQENENQGPLVNVLGGALDGAGGSVHGRLMDPILSYMPLRNNNNNNAQNQDINGVLREETVTYYE